jgi:hypothetical protein
VHKFYPYRIGNKKPGLHYAIRATSWKIKGSASRERILKDFPGPNRDSLFSNRKWRFMAAYGYKNSYSVISGHLNQ